MIDFVGEETAGADNVLRMQKGLAKSKAQKQRNRGLHFTTHLEEIKYSRISTNQNPKF
jgi:hypothetical protein